MKELVPALYSKYNKCALLLALCCKVTISFYIMRWGRGVYRQLAVHSVIVRRRGELVNIFEMRANSFEQWVQSTEHISINLQQLPVLLPGFLFSHTHYSWTVSSPQ